MLWELLSIARILMGIQTCISELYIQCNGGIQIFFFSFFLISIQKICAAVTHRKCQGKAYYDYYNTFL